MLLVSVLVTAYKFALIGFLEADSCWILALGKKIWESGSVPTSDPFSFTLPLAASFGMPQPFVVHQWFFDLLCYALFRAGKLMAVAAFCAGISALTFVSLPWRICLRANASPVAIYAISLCTAFCAALRPFVRPEILSCLCLALWLLLLQQLRTDAERVTASSANPKVSLKVVAAFFLVMLLWCNVHTGFITGLGVLAVFAASFVLQDLTVNRKFSGPAKTGLLALACSLLATLINPVGIKLWQFLPTLFGLGQYFSILEMGTIEAKNFSDLDFTPFFIMVAISLLSIITYIRAKGTTSIGRLPIMSPLRLGSVIMIIVSTYAAFQVWRLIPFSVLILAMESATLLGRSRAGFKRPLITPSPVFPCLQPRLPCKLNLIWDGLPPVLAALGVTLMANRITVLSLPQISKNWVPPVRAIQYLMDHPQTGPLFNEALIGSMLTWYLPNVKVFVDTRFDEYGKGILSDYQSVIFLQTTAPAVLKTYGIQWIFLQSDQPLTAALKKAPGWTVIYSDEDACIFRRTPKR